MIIHKNRRVRISSQNLIYFAIRWQQEKHLSTSLNIADSKYIYINVARHFITHY